MAKLKKQNVTKCISLLQEFIDGADSQSSNKRSAELALDQLQRITAGAGGNPSSCIGKPLVY